MTDIKNMDNGSADRFEQFIHDIVKDNDWEYEDGAPMTDDARAFLSRMQGWVSVDTPPEEYTPVWVQLEGGAVNMAFYETGGEFYCEPLVEVETGVWISAVDYSAGPLPVIRWQERQMPQSPKDAK